MFSLWIILANNHLHSRNIDYCTFFPLDQWNYINALGDMTSAGLYFNGKFLYDKVSLLRDKSD